MNLFQQMLSNKGLTKPDAYTPYAAGYKMYGGGRSFPTAGPVDKAGYEQREILNRAKRNAALRRMKAEQQGNYSSPDYLKGLR